MKTSLKSLLATAAAAALFAGPAMAQRQEAPASKTEAPARGAETKPSPSGQAAPAGTSGNSEIKAGADNKSRASGPDTKAPSTAQGEAKSGGSVALTTEQKIKIRSSVLTGNAPRVTNVNFSIKVGTVVPRTVRLVTVPATLVEIHPAWRGYMHFVHGDEIIIVEPGTMKIVTVIVV